MQVKKRDGRMENVSFDKILKRIEWQMEGLDRKYIEPVEIAKKVIDGLAEGISTRELDVLTMETAAMLTANHPDYSVLAARIALSNLYKETPSTFSEAMLQINQHTVRLSEDFCKIVLKHKDQIDATIDHQRDRIFDYFGFKTLERSYLIKVNEKIVERPQYMWMRVAIGIWGDNMQEVLRTYSLLSQGYFVHATPTLFNAGTSRPQLSSCFLIANKGDSLEGIMATCTDVARISSSAGGIGLHIHDVRANGSFIYKSGGISKGILPLLKTYGELARYWDQGGNKRKGSFAIYLEPWHKDIDVFLDIRKNHGKEELRARDLFNALWIPDLFMKRVEEDRKWTLFCPNEVLRATGKALQDFYGSEFEELYERCENLGIGKEIRARDLWQHIIDVQIETGTPYMAYKDAGNIKSNQKNLGTIKSSNLCIEIFEVSTPEEQAVCNLASIALPKFIRDGIFDHELLHTITKQITKNLNQVINVNFYPTQETKTSNMLRRPIGIGVQGLADTFALLDYPFDSEEARKLNKEIFETIYFAALTKSNELAIETGKYAGFDGSPVSQGILQFDMWGLTEKDLSGRWDWSFLKKNIKEGGLANSLLIALMPTASTSQILGNNECFEPFNSNLSTRNTLAGTFPLLNKHLVRDLEKENLWNKTIKNKLILENGSLQNIPEISTHLKEKYKTVYEISQKVIIDMAADRGAFVCQSQSMNLFVANANIAKVSSMHFYAWKKGLKTGMYYLRTKAASDAIKFTAEEIINIPIEENQTLLNCSLDDPENCEVCGS